MVTQTKGKMSLRQLSKELGVSHSYLSQVINGKRPASEKVAYHLLTSGLMKSGNSELAGDRGFEPLLTDSESAVLPLD